MPDTSPRMDGIQPGDTPQTVAAKPPAANSAVKKWKSLLLIVGSVLYGAYVLWAIILMSILPSADGDSKGLVLIGAGSAVIAALAFIGFALASLLHISQSKASLQARKIALIKIVVVTLPGLILSIAMPLMIMREPALTIDIVSPSSAQDLIAPVTMTFDVSRAVGLLGQKGFSPVQYRWDLNGDREVDQQTLEPRLVATFDREGIYTVSVSMVATDGSARSAGRRFIISKAVFSVTPPSPIVEEPVVFSLAHLFPDKDVITSINWDFDNDGEIDDTTVSPEASFTYFQTGRMTVSATVQLANNTQAYYERSIEVVSPPELPFPVKIVHEPANLISTAPFSALFTIDTDEPLAQIQWNFGDGQRGEGPRVAHTFSSNGSFPVQARIRSSSGVTVDLISVVRVVDSLNLPDLSFQGTPSVSGNRIRGEVPLTLNLTPVTQKSFIEFDWEAPGATEVGSTDTNLQAIYRREGTFTVYLIAQDLEDHVLRLPITVEVSPASSNLVISMDPTAGVAPLRVRFDASESSLPQGEDITGFIWGFGDSSAKEFGGASTEHVYTKQGTYIVDLTVRTTSGKQYSTTKTLVVREPLLQACILPSRVRGTVPFGVEFSADCTTGEIQRYLWDFGDSSQSDLADPVHVFDEAGTYVVRLTVTDSSGATSEATVTITAE